MKKFLVFLFIFLATTCFADTPFGGIWTAGWYSYQKKPEFWVDTFPFPGSISVGDVERWEIDDTAIHVYTIDPESYNLDYPVWKLLKSYTYDYTSEVYDTPGMVGSFKDEGYPDHITIHNLKLGPGEPNDLTFVWEKLDIKGSLPVGRFFGAVKTGSFVVINLYSTTPVFPNGERLEIQLNLYLDE
jgi:hypothetical protein